MAAFLNSGLVVAFSYSRADDMKGKSGRGLVIQPRIRVRMGDEIALGPGKVELLELVQRTGSITEAARRMGMSYMRAWKLIQTMNHCFKEALIVTSRGGRSGGGAELSEAGHKALSLYQEMEQGSLRACEVSRKALQQLLAGGIGGSS
jgi:molybdate transport system regulatory protein